MRAKQKREQEQYDLAAAADALGVSEVDFFRLAYRWWHAREPDEQTLDRAYMDHIKFGVTPDWARHMAREVAAAAAAGRLDRTTFGATGPPGNVYRPRPPPRPARLLLWIVYALLFVFFLVMATQR